MLLQQLWGVGGCVHSRQPTGLVLATEKFWPLRLLSVISIFDFIITDSF